MLHRFKYLIAHPSVNEIIGKGTFACLTKEIICMLEVRDFTKLSGVFNDDDFFSSSVLSLIYYFYLPITIVGTAEIKSVSSIRTQIEKKNRMRQRTDLRFELV